MDNTSFRAFLNRIIRNWEFSAGREVKLWHLRYGLESTWNVNYVVWFLEKEDREVQERGGEPSIRFKAMEGTNHLVSILSFFASWKRKKG
jgi:hypothetical protein